MKCAFFGHHDAPTDIQSNLHAAITELIVSHGVTNFYVGNQGNFDFAVRKVLAQLKQVYPIECMVVLAYLPSEQPTADYDGFETIFSEGTEHVPPRFAISRRNRWMVSQANYVVTYVKHSFGGAAQYKAMAERQGKHVIELAP